MLFSISTMTIILNNAISTARAQNRQSMLKLNNLFKFMKMVPTVDLKCQKIKKLRKKDKISIKKN